MDTERVPTSRPSAPASRDLAQVNRLTLAYRPTLAFLERLRARGWPDGPAAARSSTSAAATATCCGAFARLGGASGRARRAHRRRPQPLVATRRGRGRRQAGRAIDWVTARRLRLPARRPARRHHQLALHAPSRRRGAGALPALDGANARRGLVRQRPAPPPAAVPRLPPAGARLAGWHRFVQHDGPLSIARAFSRDDWQRLLDEAGVDRARRARSPGACPSAGRCRASSSHALRR